MSKSLYKNEFLESLHQAYLKNPRDLKFRKYFAFELLKEGELEEALAHLEEIYVHDKDINIEKAIRDIKSKIQTPETKKTIGFVQEEIEIIPEIINNSRKKDKISFSDVSGMDDIKENIRTDIIYPFQHPELYEQYGKKAGGGILLYGPPGCGKTYIARATAGEIDATFISVSIHEIISSFLGEGERILHEKFEEAREKAPSVLFFDEVDAIGMSRGKTSNTLRTLVNQFLIELDGMDSRNEGVLVIGATNLPWEVDDALRRPGRFNRVLFVTPPDKKARIHMFEILIDKVPHEKINYETLANDTKRYSAADISKICSDASDTAFKMAIKSGKLEKLTQKILEDAVKNSKSSVTDWFGTVRNYIDYSNQSGLYDDVKSYIDSMKNEDA